MAVVTCDPGVWERAQFRSEDSGVILEPVPGDPSRCKPLFGPERKTVREVWSECYGESTLGTVKLWEWTDQQ